MYKKEKTNKITKKYHKEEKTKNKTKRQKQKQTKRKKKWNWENKRTTTQMTQVYKKKIIKIKNKSR